MRKRSIVSRVLDVAAAKGVIRRKDVCAALGIGGDQADSAIRALMERRALVRVERGTYRFAGMEATAREAETEEKIWRAMKINPTWSASDIAMQAGTTTNYIYKKLRIFRADGLVRPAGVRPIATGGAEKLWRVTMKGRQRTGRPVENEYSPDPLVVAAVTLNRLICTGMAQRYGEQAEEAVRLCGEIVAGLREE
jgi:predicted transcriptional regulator